MNTTFREKNFAWSDSRYGVDFDLKIKYKDVYFLEVLQRLGDVNTLWPVTERIRLDLRNYARSSQ